MTCNSGYVLTGSGIRTCLGDGTWSGTDGSCRKPQGGHRIHDMNAYVIIIVILRIVKKYSSYVGYLQASDLIIILYIK